MLNRLLFVMTLGLTSCMVGPDYKDPKTNIADHWPKKNKSVQEKPFKTFYWWKIFKDPNLTQLIEDGYHHNLNLKKTGVHVLQARAQLAKTVGQLYPQQQAVTGNLTYYRMGGNYLQFVLPSDFTAASLGPVLNWEIDFWGKYRRAIQSNDASFLSSIAAYDAALVTLTADIASTYVELRETESLISVTEENIHVQQTSLNLTRSRYEAGEVSLLDLEEANASLSETEAELPSLYAKLQYQKDALAVLLGTVPNEIDQKIHSKTGIPTPPLQMNIGIPRETLARRPDVQQARLNAIAQSEAIGANKAQLFPSFALTGSFVFSSNTINGASINELFNLSNLNVMLGPAVNWPFLNYGQLTNLVRVQDAIFQQALFDYMNIILIAQQEVQDSIASYIGSKKTTTLLKKAVDSAVSATQLTLIQYKEGETDFTTVLYAEQQQLRIQKSYVKAKASVPKAVIALYRALGGGFELRGNDDVISNETKQMMENRTDWGDLLIERTHDKPKTAQEQYNQIYPPQW